MLLYGQLVCLLSLCNLVAAAPTTRTSSTPNSAFDVYHHLGNLSPYSKAPNTPLNLSSGVPPGCKVDKAFLIHRHGSRQPLSDEITYIQNLSSYINSNKAIFSKPATKPPSKFSFLQLGWNSTFTINDLSAPGRQQLFDHGVAFKLKHPQLYTNQVLAGNQDRVVESAEWFMDGYYGRYASSNATLNLIAENSTTVSWITSMDTCDAWEYSFGSDLVDAWGAVYLPPITARLNKQLSASFPGVNFTADHVHGMLYACAYGTAVYGENSSPWCALFTPEEILHNEYEYDLLMRGAFGYGQPGDMGPVLGSFLVGNVSAFMHQSSANLSLNFGHDTTIDQGLTALNLAYDDAFPSEGPPNPDRAWRTAKQVPFAAQMLWYGLACDGGQQRIQLSLNEANFDLAPTGCESDRYGTCAFEDFFGASTVRKAVDLTYGDARWNASCAS